MRRPTNKLGWRSESKDGEVSHGGHGGHGGVWSVGGSIHVTMYSHIN
jgi:hypothetical protein